MTETECNQTIAADYFDRAVAAYDEQYANDEKMMGDNAMRFVWVRGYLHG
jgi:hypothetical protein